MNSNPSNGLYLRPSGYTQRRRRLMPKVLMLVLAMLAAWLLSGCHLKEQPPLSERDAQGLFLLVMLVICTALSIRFVCWVEKKQMERARALPPEMHAVAVAEEQRDLASPTPCEVLAVLGIGKEMLLRRLASMIVECCLAEELVRKSRTAESDLRLGEAMKCMHGVKLCLGELADCASKGEEPELVANTSHEGRAEA